MWRALRDHLPKGWLAWHSLRLRDGDNLDGEGDFVIAAPKRGLLVLEVKGGHVEVRDGRWFQNGKPLKTAPSSRTGIKKRRRRSSWLTLIGPPRSDRQ